MNEPAAPVAIDSTPATVTYGSTLAIKLTFNKDLDSDAVANASAGEQGGALPQIAWDERGGEHGHGPLDRAGFGFFPDSGVRPGWFCQR